MFSACEQVVVRYFPVSTMTKEKQIKLGYTPHIDQLPKEGIQIRSNIFQVNVSMTEYPDNLRPHLILFCITSYGTHSFNMIIHKFE